ncbi:DUF3592 domain-containing protein (plasmid) [Nostoc sp. UHCC 0302]|uniref:DUF3592 domain-containing protein n=1 Tax=Nostoc sp. UHCC 0302 TaxID=3134896 RepID=UPI00311CDBBE
MNVKLRQITFEDKWNGVYLVLFGLLMMGAGFYANNQITHEHATFTQTQGKVIDIVHHRERDSKDKLKDTYAPIIEFPAKGALIRFTGRYESYRASNGKIVAVRYDPKQPATTAHEVQSFESFTPWAAFSMGGLSLIFGLCRLSPIRLSSDKS